MQNTLINQLNSLRLTGMVDALKQQQDQPTTYSELGFLERLGLLVNSELTVRDHRKISRLLKVAKLRVSAHPNDLDYRSQRGLSKDLVAQLLSFDWVAQHRNVLIEGPTGTGKTYLACVLGQAACERGISVRYLRASRLFDMLTLGHADGSYGNLLSQLQKTEILIIDDWGLEILKRTQRTDLLEVLEDRHDRGCTIITSQLPTQHWHEVIGDPTLADAVLDRLLHNAHKVVLKGESMRKKQTKIANT
jgi:DNA replication protein DnaC